MRQVSSVKIRALAVLIGVALAMGVAIGAIKLQEDGTNVRLAQPKIEGGLERLLARLPISLPGYGSCPRLADGCAPVEMTLKRYAELRGEDPMEYVQNSPTVPRWCPRPEGAEERTPALPCEEHPASVTVVVYMPVDDARAFIQEHECGRPVSDPCY